jgi:hypothetical protein
MGVIEFIREELQLWCLAGARGVSHLLALGSSDSLLVEVILVFVFIGKNLWFDSMVLYGFKTLFSS